MRKYCPFSGEQHVSTHWVLLLMYHHVRRHKPRIRARPALLAGHQDFLWDLAQDILCFLCLIKTMSHIREWRTQCHVHTHVALAHTWHMLDMLEISNKQHTSSGSRASSPVWHLAQDELTFMCHANATHKSLVPQICLFCYTVLLLFLGFFLLLIS